MAQEILVIVKEPLTGDMIEAGRAVIGRLDRYKFPITAALWLYESERGYWRLLLASPKRGEEGSLKTYQRVFGILREEPFEGFSYIDLHISVVDAKDPLISGLRKAVKRSDVRWGGPVNGTYVEDAYIYRTAA